MKFENIEKLIIFPDIHGRKFWRDIYRVYLGRPEYGFIFLGDYLDPYEFEGISEDEAWNNFIELWGVFNCFPDRVIWLLGNHDYHYLPWMSRVYGCRRSYKNYDKISNFFDKNYDKFKLAFEFLIKNKKYLFTHAGVSSGWKKINSFGDEVYTADFLNKLKDNHNITLWQIGWDRGGREPNGSPLWADLYEMQYSEYPKNVYQIFGHTLSYPSPAEPLITENFAMLDSKKPFVLDLKSGKLSPNLNICYM